MTVNRSTQALSVVPMWITTSDLYPTLGNIPVNVGTSNAANSLDRNHLTLMMMNSASNTWVFELMAGNSLYGCDQLAFYGDLVNKSPIQMTIKGEGMTESIKFNVTTDKMKEIGGATYFTIPHDRDFPTTYIKFSHPSTSGAMAIREFLPLGGNRYYKRVYYSSVTGNFYKSRYGRDQYFPAQNELPVRDMILPPVPHTLTKIDEDNWKATLTTTALGTKKTSMGQYNPGNLAYDDMTKVVALNTTFPGKSAGNYWFKLTNTIPFMAFTLGDNWFIAGSTFPDGRIGALVPSPVTYEGSGRILPSSVLANVPVTGVRVANASNIYSDTIESANSVVINRFRNYRNLSQNRNEFSNWSVLNGSIQPGGMTCDTGDLPLTDNVYDSCGNSGGIQFAPATAVSKMYRQTSAGVQVNLWWRVS